MRLKLIVIASLVAAVIGSGGAIMILIWTVGSVTRAASDPTLSRHNSTFLLPLFFAALAGIFVYRHTARRRKFQAAMTVVLALLFSIAAHIAALLLKI